MNHRFILCLLFISGIFFTSCRSYRVLDIEVLEVPRVHTDGSRIAFLNRNNIYESDTSFMLYHYDGIRRNDLIAIFYTGLNRTLAENSLFDSLVMLTNTHPTYLTDKELPDAILSSDVNALCEKLGLDYIISLEYSRYNVDPVSNILNDNFFIRLYDRNIPVDSVLLRDEIILNEDLNFIEYISAITFFKGVEYADRLIPNWSKGERRVYDSGKVMRMGSLFLQDNKQDEALKLWEAVTRLSGKQALRAYMNMAWVYENAGDFERALALLDKAELLIQKGKQNQNDVEYLHEYQKIIAKRIRDMELMGSKYQNTNN